MTSVENNTTAFRLVSLVIVLVLGLQIFAIFAFSGRWTWPFTDYPMYSKSHYDGDRVVAGHFVFATTADGEETEITPESLGVNVFVFERWSGTLMGSRWQAPQGDERAAAPHRPTPLEIRVSWPLRQWLTSTSLFQSIRRKPNPDLVPLFIEHYEAVHGQKIVRLRVEDTAVVVTRAGPAPAPPRVVEIDLPMARSQ